MDADRMAACVSDRGIGEVAICDMKKEDSVRLQGADGRRFCEVATNLWADDAYDEGVAYLGTSRHGGGIVLRPLFARVDGEWANVSTGKDAPDDLAAQFDAHASLLHAASAASEPIRVFEDVTWQQHCDDLVLLCESFSWSKQLKGVYQHLCDAAARILKCNQVHLHLMSADGTRFVKQAYFDDGLPTPEWENFCAADIGRTCWMMEKKLPIIMDYEHPHLQDSIPSTALDSGILSAVSIPLQADGQVFGMLTPVYRARTAWSEEDVDYLVIMGRVIGSHIQRLYDTKKASELQVLNERRMLSTEIHENVSSLLGALSVNAAAAVAAFDEGDEDAARGDLGRLEKTARETMRILRDEMFSLRISLENTDGLVDGIEETLSLFKQNWGIDTELEIVGEQPVVVPLHVSLQLARVLNECLSNTLKHAHASIVRVVVDNSPTRLSLSVEDDGVGFDVDAVGADRFGLDIMRERAAAAGGRLTILSNNGGTVVRVDVDKQQRYQEGLRDS